MQDEDLILQKREQSKSRTKKVSIGPKCPVCDIKFGAKPNRDHVSSHFMDELKAYVESVSTTATGIVGLNFIPLLIKSLAKWETPLSTVVRCTKMGYQTIRLLKPVVHIYMAHPDFAFTTQTN